MIPDSGSGEIALLYVPCGSAEEAESIARALLKERLIACGNIYESRSLYRWEGEIADEKEHVLLCKTAPARAHAARKRIGELHSYKVPCILSVVPAQANAEYAGWIMNEVTGVSGAV